MVGKAVPLVFVIGLVGVSLVGYSFVRLTRYLNHAGSAYALVGATVGPRAGFFSGFAMLGAYVGFCIGTLALTGAFANSLLAEMQHGAAQPYQLPWLVPVVIATALSFVLTGRDARVLAKILLAIEGVGIIAMVVLAVVIIVRGGAQPTGVDFSTFSASGVSGAAVMGGVVAAFLCWAGFEACASMGEETADPQRNIPRALIGTLVLTGVLFVVVMFAQTIGFGTDKAGLGCLPAFRQHSGRARRHLYRGVVQSARDSHRDSRRVRMPHGDRGHLGSDALRIRPGRIRSEVVGAHPSRDGRTAPRHLACCRGGSRSQPHLRGDRMAARGYRQPGDRHLFRVRGRRFSLPDGVLPDGRGRRHQVRRRNPVHRRSRWSRKASG